MNGWAIRSAHGPNGEVVQFRERPKPGHPGVLERVYDNAPDRYATGGTMELLRPGERSRYRRPTRTLARTFASSTHTPRVALSTQAADDLEQCIRHSRAGLETAGGLFGTVTKTGLLIVREATLAVRNPQPNSALIDVERIDRQTERKAQDGLMLVGSWHTEPTAVGAGDPSPADLDHWTSFARTNSEPFFAGLRLRRPTRWHLGWRDAWMQANVYARTAAGVELAAVQTVKENPSIL